VPEHLATLLGQRGELSGELALPCHTDREDLLGFLRVGAPQKAGKRRRCEPHPASGPPHGVGHPKERFDGVGADRQSDLIEA